MSVLVSVYDAVSLDFLSIIIVPEAVKAPAAGGSVPECGRLLGWPYPVGLGVQGPLR